MLGHSKIKENSSYANIYDYEEEYEIKQQEREERLLDKKLKAIYAIADSINNLAKVQEEKIVEQPQNITLNLILTNPSDAITLHVKEMLEALEKKK